jgi:hypothetical protein
MRTLFFTTAAIAASIATLGEAVKLNDPQYETYAQVNVF